MISAGCRSIALSGNQERPSRQRFEARRKGRGLNERFLPLVGQGVYHEAIHWDASDGLRFIPRQLRRGISESETGRYTLSNAYPPVFTTDPYTAQVTA